MGKPAFTTGRFPSTSQAPAIGSSSQYSASESSSPSSSGGSSSTKPSYSLSAKPYPVHLRLSEPQMPSEKRALKMPYPLFSWESRNDKSKKGLGRCLLVASLSSSMGSGFGSSLNSKYGRCNPNWNTRYLLGYKPKA